MNPNPYPLIKSVINIASDFTKWHIFNNNISIKQEIIESIVDEIWRKESILEKKYNLQGGLDKHKLAALLTIKIYEQKPIITLLSGVNKYAEVANKYFAIYAGYSLIGNASIIPDELMVSILQQLDEGEHSLLSLAAQYYMVETYVN